MSYTPYYGYPSSYSNYYGGQTRSTGGGASYVRPVSGLELDRKKRQQEQKQNCLKAAVVILLLLLIAVVAVVVWLYLKKPESPVDVAAVNVTTEASPTVSFLQASVLATRTDVTFGSEYADPNQNAFQSLAQTTCYQISAAANSANYVVTNCTVNNMSASQTTGLDIDISLRVFIANQTPEEAIVGLGTALSGVEAPLVIDKNNVKLV